MTDHKYTECSSCFKDLNEYEIDDPAEIEGRIFCDACASEFVKLRCGNLRNCADMVKELRMENTLRLYDLAPINEVFHEAIEKLNTLRYE